MVQSPCGPATKDDRGNHFMYKIDFSNPIHLHFIGIGGISMSGLAEILMKEGFIISGSDSQESDLVARLRSQGALVNIGQRAENITDDIEAVVYTAAIHPDNPEYQAALQKGLPMMTRAELLGQIMTIYETPIAVAGTHGKTTTTSMIATVLMEAGTDPTVSVGGIIPAIGSNIRVGSSGLFVAEACEYTNSFLSFFPKIAVILNVDEDHLDFFKDIYDIAASFHRFACLVPRDGALVINRDTRCYDIVTEGLDCPIVTYSIENAMADYTAADLTVGKDGCCTFTCLEKGQPLTTIALSVPGRHNVIDALATIATLRVIGLEAGAIAEGLGRFGGAARRFETKGTVGGVTIVDDYAHHPAEIDATLTAAAGCVKRELYVAFQPHTYTRTQALMGEFARVLKKADHVLLADIYAAREKNTLGISSADLRDAINALGGHADYFTSFGEIEDYVLTHCVDGDMFITMGAGDIYKVGDDLLGR